MGSTGWIALGLWGVTSCAPSGQREEPVSPRPSTRDAAAPPAEPESPRRVPETNGPEPEPEPEPAVSAMPKRRKIVSESVQPGLVAFADEMADEGLLWVGRLEGNGGRDVLVHVPPGADDHADFRIVYHFHGTYSETFEKQRPGLPKRQWVGWNRLEQTLAAAAELQDRHDYNVALVYPFSAGKRREPGAKGWWNGAYDRMWMARSDDPDYRDSFERLHEEVLAILREDFGAHPSKLEHPVVAEGHSAGGIALRNIAVSGTQAVGEYVFQDAGFQTWADGCFEAITKGRSSGRITLIITKGGIADPLQGRDPWCTRLEADQHGWVQQARWCASRMERKPPGSQRTCAELEAGAEAWPEFHRWCEGMKNGMRDVAEVVVHHTKIPHGKQPRHFTGGLELPAAWHQGRDPSTR
jgi:hypothetical protein